MNPSPLLRYASYARISTSQQAEWEFSIPTQRRECRFLHLRDDPQISLRQKRDRLCSVFSHLMPGTNMRGLSVYLAQ